MDFFVICKRKLDFFEKMIYAYKQAERMRKTVFSGRTAKKGENWMIRKRDGGMTKTGTIACAALVLALWMIYKRRDKR